MAEGPSHDSPRAGNMSSSSPDMNDLGFGARVSQSTRNRYLNRDGTFNARRIGLPWFRSLNYFHALMTTTWPRLFLIISAAYLLLNVFFAELYLLCGPHSLEGGTGASITGHFADAFFFSVHTLATIGYGTIHPGNLASNIVVTIEALVGLCTFALATGIIFSRFSRPVARVAFSEFALVAPYRGIRAFEFRVINTSSSELVEVGVKVLFSRKKANEARTYQQLKLERDNITFFPMQWTVVHPIDESSPLYGCTEQELRESAAEFIILLTAIEETFSQQVHTRTSYLAEEIVYGAKFRDMYVQQDGEALRSDVRLLSAYNAAELPAQPAQPA